MSAHRRIRTLVPFTIPNGTALSGEVNVADGQIVGIIAPAAWTAGGLTMQALTAEPSALPKVPVWGEVLVDAASAVWTITAITAGAYYGFAASSPLSLVAPGRVRIRSGTSGVPVNQGADRSGFLVVLI